MPNPIRQSYRVYRRAEGGQQEILVGEREAGMEKNQSLTDQSFEWEKTYYYRATTFTLIAQPGKPDVSIEGDDTPEVKVFADDVFPPAVPSGLQAVFSGPGQQLFIDLIWAPVTDADLEGYNVYRHEEGIAPVKVNAELVKMPAFRDMQVVSGKTYFYSVSAVDLRGNESARSEEAGESVP
jgi:fibronectin type 3 domain-containing protein